MLLGNVEHQLYVHLKILLFKAIFSLCFIQRTNVFLLSLHLTFPN